jgi:endo-1,4-beta-xylanase
VCRPYLTVTALVLWLAGCGGGSSTPALVQSVFPAQQAVPVSLSAAVTSEGFRAHAWRVDIGAQVGGDEIFFNPGDGKLLPTIAREANVLLIGNNLKWAASGVRALRPTATAFDFTDADALVQFGVANGMKIKAHTLVWGEALPTWLTSGTWTTDQLRALLRDHISTVVGRYRGRIQIWDVVNEAYAFDGSYKDNFWYQKLGPEYIDLAFQYAHEADPSALLFMNEDGTEGLGTGSDAFLAKVSALVRRGIPINGVGLETHVDLAYKTLGGSDTATPVNLAANMRRLGDLGLQVHVSEFDVRLPLPVTTASLLAQADVYRAVYQDCADTSACTGFYVWGVTNKWSWISRAFAGFGAALVLDELYQPKSAYFALLAALRASTDECLDWAGKTYTQTIRPAKPVSGSSDNYYYRYFSETRNYVGIQNGRVVYWDPATMPGPIDVMSLTSCIASARTGK